MSSDKTMDLLNLQFVGGENETQQMVFNLEEEEFGIDVLKVQEIIRFIKPVKVPNVPDGVYGVINFRGEVIPVLNLRKIFSLPELVINDFTVIIIVKTEEKSFGMIVDKVSDIVSIPEENIQKTDFGGREKTKFLRAMGKLENRLILMLDLDKVIDFEKMEESLQNIEENGTIPDK